MIKLLQTIGIIASLTISACLAQETTPSQNTPEIQTPVNYAFTKKELTGLVMVTQSYLDGHTLETGQLKEGATLLIFEENFAWAFGQTSPEKLQSKHTKFSWKLNSKGQVLLQDIPDDSDVSPSSSNCTLTKVNEHKREFTKDGLAEKIDTVFTCDGFPKDMQYKQTFLLPLPLFPHMMPGVETHFSDKPEATSTFKQDRTVKRPDPMKPGEGIFLYDPYKGGKYHHSITVFQTDIERSDAGEKTRITGKHRLLIFGHGTIAHSTMLDLSHSPIIYTPPGDDGYAHTSVDRYELHSVYRVKNLIYNPMVGKNYADRPSDIARSVNANKQPLKSALIFNE